MSEILAVQHAFADALRNADQAELFLAELSGSSARNLEILAIYRGNLIANTHGALKLAYPVLQAVLGEECFAELARLYWHEHPPGEGDLNRYGQLLPELVQSRTEFAAMPWAMDLARLEWQLHYASMSADFSPLSIKALARLEAAQLAKITLKLQPGLALIESAWPLVSLWQQHQPEWQGEFDLAGRGAEIALIHRRGLRAVLSIIEPGQASLLQHLQAGKSLQVALLTVSEQRPEFDPQAALLKLFDDELIVDFKER